MIKLIENPDLCGHLLPYIPSNELDRVFQLNRVTEASKRSLRPQVKESFEKRKLSGTNTYRWLESSPGLRKFAALLKANFLTVEEIRKLLVHIDFSHGIRDQDADFLNEDRTEIDPNAFIIRRLESRPQSFGRFILEQTMLHDLSMMLGNSNIFRNAQEQHPEVEHLSDQARVEWYVQNIFNRLTQTEKAGLKALIDDSINKRVPFIGACGDTMSISNFYLTNGGRSHPRRSRCPQHCNIL